MNVLTTLLASEIDCGIAYYSNAMRNVPSHIKSFSQRDGVSVHWRSSKRAYGRRLRRRRADRIHRGCCRRTGSRVLKLINSREVFLFRHYCHIAQAGRKSSYSCRTSVARSSRARSYVLICNAQCTDMSHMSVNFFMNKFFIFFFGDRWKCFVYDVKFKYIGIFRQTPSTDTGARAASASFVLHVAQPRRAIRSTTF